MKAMSETTLRRKLDKLGYRLSKKDGSYLIADHDTGGTVHPSTYTPYCLDLDEVNEWYRELS
ncbi:hypothetical protein [uncultured Ruegeria sp.]|uniref:hypothetical protein n=1 Tax=uncultured Ruegeria sp. TaxID=259304 RepID=UPI0026273142|nr:hypothetical protein [uncultured Ruegeria sp.]